MAAILYNLYTEHGVWNLGEVYDYLVTSELEDRHILPFMAACMEVRAENYDAAKKNRAAPKPYRKKNKKNKRNRKKKRR